MLIESSLELYRNGETIRLYRESVDPRWQGIAAVLIGKHREGLDRLEPFTGEPFADLHRAFAYWCLRENEQALAALHAGEALHQKLKELINRKVRILLQGRNDGCPGWCLCSYAKRDPDFEILTVGKNSRDDIKPGFEDTWGKLSAQLGGFSPDLFFSSVIEFQVVPLGLERAPFPVLFLTHDTLCSSRHIKPFHRLCDCFVTLGSQAYSEVRAHSDAFVVTYPKFFGLDPAHWKDLSAEKERDVGWSGSLPNHDGACDRWSVLGTFIEGLEGRSLEFRRFKSTDYEQFQASSKVVPTYIGRNQDSFSSRSLEAIAAGAVALVPHGNATALYFSEDEGLVQYDLSAGADAAKRVLENWEGQFRGAALLGRQKALHEFDYARIVNESLKFTAFIALQIDLSRRPVRSEAVSFSRSYVTVASDVFNPDADTDRSILDSTHRYLMKLTERFPEPHLLNTAAAMLSSDEISLARKAEIFERALALDGQRGVIILNLAMVYLRQKRFVEARSLLKSMVQISPAELKWCWEDDHEEIPRILSSLEFLTRAQLPISPDNPERNSYLQSVAWLLLGDIAEKEEEELLAREGFERAYELHPDGYWSILRLAECLLKLTERAERLRGADLLLQVISKHPGYLLENSETIFETLIGLGRESAASLLRMRLERWNAAILNEPRQSASSLEIPIFRELIAAVQKGDLDRAWAMTAECRRRFAGNDEIIQSLAGIELRLQRLIGTLRE